MSSTGADSNGNGPAAADNNNSSSNNNNNNSSLTSGGGGGGGRVDPDIDDVPGEATLLVSEFPPPPFYYTRALQTYRVGTGGENTNTTTSSVALEGVGESSSSTTTTATTTTTPRQLLLSCPLVPPEIPVDALSRGTRRAAAAAARARAEAERLRLIEMGTVVGNDDDDDARTGAILGAVGVGTNTGSIDDKEEEGDVVAVFGEIVEDPMLVIPIDVCDDPKIVRTELKRLNRQVVQGFVQLVQDLVHRPTDNKKTRDELSHKIFLMLQECNKFREHQSREILIELLEKQLRHRKRLLKELRNVISEADDLLSSTSLSS